MEKKTYQQPRVRMVNAATEHQLMAASDATVTTFKVGSPNSLGIEFQTPVGGDISGAY